MPFPAVQFALRAKQQEIESMRSLADRIELTDLVGQVIHMLQSERGATSIYLASGGQRFSSEQNKSRAEAQSLVMKLRDRFDQHLLPEPELSSRPMSLFAWVILDLDSLEALRKRIDCHVVSTSDSIRAFSKVIGGLTEMIFKLADRAPDPRISRMLVALVHLVQGKEEAGQERAVGAHMFAAEVFSADQQQRLLYLIGAQERSLEVFTHFAEASQCRWWKERALAPHITELVKQRRILCSARAGDTFEDSLSELWFDITSARITDLWYLQMALTVHVRQACEMQIEIAQQALHDSEKLMSRWLSKPPAHAHAIEHFFADDADFETSTYTIPEAVANADRLTIIDLKTVLQRQSARLVRAEVEMDEARHALHEHKVVQRAKIALMAEHGLSEAAAFRLLQKTSMDKSTPIVKVAEKVLLSLQWSSDYPASRNSRRRAR